MDSEGYLVPADAPLSMDPGFLIKALPMRDFGSLVRLAKSKHVLSIFDSCFSGTIFEARGGTPKPITGKTTKAVRQFITSGDAGQQVRDDGSFREYFVRALGGEEKADFNGDGYVTGEELGLFLGQRMAALTDAAQTPKAGKLHDVRYNQGDFVFVLPGRAVASRPATIAPTAPGGGGFSLDDLRKQQRVRAGWERWQQAMGAAFSEAATFDGETGLRRTAWDRFLSAYKEDNPFSEDDERLRERAQRRKAEALVAAVQRELAAHGYKPGAVDGRLGANTKAAIENFQRRQGRAVDGRATETLLASLHRLPKPAPSPVKLAVGVFFKPGDTFKDCADCPEMVVIPAGSFRMGDLNGGGDSDEKPVHWVTIPRPFAVGKYEVTQAEWREVIGSNPSRFKGGRNPVEQVSWDDAQDFVRRLGTKTGKQYRLLMEAEWEYAARAGTVTKYPWGNSFDSGRANDGSRTVPVGRYALNSFGLHDMHGNVREWVEDCWHGSYSGAPTNGSAWTSGGDCRERVLRGGSWYFVPWDLRSAYRLGVPSGNRFYYDGFRVARTL
ncbi:MAG TPA: SUMF1/EgtB/PvdO family nonheme iron enzyme [Rhodospirillales bacterium]|nr:SUMF1/EgtB/PvdO family nonheme iron enzyme [Rhodospirillaceae bacterium]HJP53584.1 SUMF1/EgtB/PvdO family nonheme iron enzyme [Rhodospirillales bacterium]